MAISTSGMTYKGTWVGICEVLPIKHQSFITGAAYGQVLPLCAHTYHREGVRKEWAQEVNKGAQALSLYNKKICYYRDIYR